ncbi:hypothetical protein [Nocardioides stalactiti]|nr:hypothetical protein [Nocardioides stalactiti]
MHPYIIQSEMEYRRDKNRKAIAAQRGGRSRSSWLRRVAAAEKSI